VSGLDHGNGLSERSEIFIEVLAGVVAYLVRHPEAKDTVEGIGKWWHGHEGSEWPPSVLSEVLAYLLERQWMLVRNLSPGEQLYRGNPQHLADMQRFLSRLNRDRSSKE
jgi:hypothetical protein